MKSIATNKYFLTIFFFLGTIPWALIITIIVAASIMSFAALIYGYKFHNSCYETGEMFKAVDKEADKKYKVDTVRSNPSSPINGMVQLSSNKDIPSGDWTEMQDMPSPHSGKRPDYQRAASKDCMEVRVDEKGKSTIFKLFMYLRST